MSYWQECLVCYADTANPDGLCCVKCRTKYHQYEWDAQQAAWKAHTDTDWRQRGNRIAEIGGGFAFLLLLAFALAVVNAWREHGGLL